MNKSTPNEYKIYTDGGSRGNPGPAAFGFVIYDSSGSIVQESKVTIGVATNNQAEYQALVAALTAFENLSVPLESSLVCYSDSQLMVRQINGQYKMKNAELKPWLDRIHELRKSIMVPVTFVDIRRDQNKHADGLVNQALDEVNHG